MSKPIIRKSLLMIFVAFYFLTSVLFLLRFSLTNLFLIESTPKPLVVISFIVSAILLAFFPEIKQFFSRHKYFLMYIYTFYLIIILILFLFAKDHLVLYFASITLLFALMREFKNKKRE
ncbi:hypothetical protein P6P90_09445 [Ectobacillus antri]|jgi:hypothetical protein|uniref:Uncharacterized protein n=1 Tax=Ectobacillus antri TaxID=2486280 RepID=A0ABT6H5S8_9BACI|nr:hypothetical protein [Ectobacillus antri]MDG4656910.1 hypothetical protein [Ectobacillus antri]MDG5754193.1 hypothetical protein [Ectobacillus antri]